MQTGLTPSRTRAGAWPDTRPRPTLAGPMGTLRGEGTLQSQHSPCRMRQKNQTSMGTGTGEVAPWCPHGGVTECVSGPRAWAERSQVASAVWQAGEAGPVFPPSRYGTLLPLRPTASCVPGCQGSLSHPQLHFQGCTCRFSSRFRFWGRGWPGTRGARRQRACAIVRLRSTSAIGVALQWHKEQSGSRPRPVLSLQFRAFRRRCGHVPSTRSRRECLRFPRKLPYTLFCKFLFVVVKCT